tara:strand:- start:461 stop:682 length:222 start_codon:yes stop_codon:yes gene_type:complete
MAKTAQAKPEYEHAKERIENWEYGICNGLKTIKKNETDYSFEDSLLSRIQNEDTEGLKKLNQKIKNGERIRLW